MVKPLKDRIVATLIHKGPATSDRLAQRLSVKAKEVSARCAELRKARTISAIERDGETVFQSKQIRFAVPKKKTKARAGKRK
jgi:transcription initiation factor IIE alpha subunit